MNDLTKSYYEIASEEAARDDGKSPMMQGQQVDPTRQAMQQLIAILKEQGIEYGTPEFDAAFQDAMGMGDDPDDVMREDQENNDRGYSDPARNKQDRLRKESEPDGDEDDELMDNEQRVQSKMTRYK